MADPSNGRVTFAVYGSNTFSTKGIPMFLALVLSYLNRSARFSWSPSLDLKDHAIYSTLLPGTQY
jgi:hypothetical protein